MTVKGTLYVISAPSGGGKTSLVNALIAQTPGIRISVSHTTRAPRVGETEGKNYFFVDEKAFTQHQQAGLFLEHAKVFQHWYGTSSAWVMEQLAAGTDVILEIDWQGARKIKEQMECVCIFIIPPSRDVLLTRLETRKQDSQEIIASRMLQASNEISHYIEYDFMVVNDNFEEALQDLSAIIKAMRLKVASQKQRYQDILASLIGHR